MGVKTTMANLNLAGSHLLAATTSGANATSVPVEILLTLGECINDLTILRGSMQAGDQNITTITAQITALS
jgi:hypothetical protein